MGIAQVIDLKSKQGNMPSNVTLGSYIIKNQWVVDLRSIDL
jgi:hypothetical protein